LDDSKFGEQIASGLRWVTAARLASQLVTWVFTVVVMRVLEPTDYGIVAMATSFIGLLQMLREFGLGAAIIQRKELPEEVLRSIFGVLIAVNTFLCILVFTLSPIAGRFYQEPRVVPVLAVLGVQFLLVPFDILPNSLLLRRMRFRETSIARFVSAVSGGLVTVSLALFGYGLWALVAGAWTTSLIGTVALNVMSPYLRRPKFSLRGMSDVLSFSGFVAIDQILWFLYSQSDILIVGKLLGSGALGIYSVGVHIASMPMQRVNAVLNQVAFPAFSRIQHDRALIRTYLTRAIRVLSVLSCPVFFGMAAIARDAVPIVIGERWQEAALPLSILSLVKPLRMESSLLPMATRGADRADISVVNLLFASVIMPVSFIIGCSWGVKGVSYAWLAAYPIVFIIEIARSKIVTDLGVLDFAKKVAKPALAAVLMMVAVVAARPGLIGMQAVLMLVCEIGIGLATYGLFVWVLDREAVADALRLVRR
jgi:O-antigen/teichoic acid export membrane protein